jgi:Fanconi anemia group M protein
MTQEDLAEIQRVTGLVAEPQLLVTEGERLRELGREVARAERALYFKILERGVIGLRDEELYEEMVEEGFSKGVVKAAMSRLTKGSYVTAEAGRSAIPVKAIPGTRLMDIEVEKVLTGLAVVWVDDRWRARLSPEDYDGPRDLMRKGARFRALCRLYHDSGVLCVRVRQVVQAERRR